MESQDASTTTTVAVVVTAEETTPRKPSSSPIYRRNMTPDKRSSFSVHCRICHEDGSMEELIDPCNCAGTLGLIHTSCLEKWLSTSNTDRCEICKYSFVIQKKNKPLSQWWKSKNVHGPQGVGSDVLCLIVLTPFCIAATYLCGVGASAYSRLGFWEGTGLTVLCCILVVTYCLWLIVTVRFHYKSWKQWCRRNQDVKLVVKHKAEKPLNIKNCWIQSQDTNNNRSDHANRFTAWLVESFNSNEDPLYTFSQTTIV